MGIRRCSRLLTVLFFLPLCACAAKNKPPAFSLNAAQAVRYFEYGLSNLQQGKPKKAEKDFRKAIRLDPAEALFYQGLGAALQDQGKPEAAALALLDGASLNSSKPNLFFQLGDVFTDCKCWAGVIKYTLFALDFNEFKLRAPALSNLGLAYMGLQFWEPARYTLEAALLEDADYVSARWRLILTLRELEEWPALIRNGRRLLRFSEEHPHHLTDFFLSQVHEQIAVAYSKLGKPYVAEPFKKKAQLLAPSRTISLDKQ